MCISCLTLICTSSGGYLEHKQSGNSFMFISISRRLLTCRWYKMSSGYWTFTHGEHLAGHIFQPAAFYFVLWIHNASVSNCVFRNLDFFFLVLFQYYSYSLFSILPSLRWSEDIGKLLLILIIYYGCMF